MEHHAFLFWMHDYCNLKRNYFPCVLYVEEIGFCKTFSTGIDIYPTSHKKITKMVCFNRDMELHCICEPSWYYSVRELCSRLITDSILQDLDTFVILGFMLIICNVKCDRQRCQIEICDRQPVQNLFSEPSLQLFFSGSQWKQGLSQLFNCLSQHPGIGITATFGFTLKIMSVVKKQCMFMIFKVPQGGINLKNMHSRVRKSTFKNQP